MRCRAYYKDESGQLTIGTVEAIDGLVYTHTGKRITPDWESHDLVGWPDTHVYSYDQGRVLITEHEVKEERK